jgi:hypothetical protein
MIRPSDPSVIPSPEYYRIRCRKNRIDKLKNNLIYLSIHNENELALQQLKAYAQASTINTNLPVVPATDSDSRQISKEPPVK